MADGTRMDSLRGIWAINVIAKAFALIVKVAILFGFGWIWLTILQLELLFIGFLLSPLLCCRGAVELGAEPGAEEAA